MSHIRIKIFGIIALLTLGLFQTANAQNFLYSTPLVAGRVNDIGTIYVERDADTLTVTYDITEQGWSMTKTFLHVTDNPNGFPTLPSGVPDIQSFTYKTNHDELDSFTYKIDVTGLTYVYISANANVSQESYCKVDPSIINATVPSDPVLQLVSLSGNPAYFRMYVYDYNGNAPYQGFFFGNCVDLENPIDQRVRYFPKLVSSYDTDTDLLECIVDRPENLDVVNFLINQDYATKFGASSNDIQAAIWTLIDDDNPVSGVAGFNFSDTVVNMVINDAKAKGEFYVPSCDEYFLVLLDHGCKDALANNQTPNITIQQSVMWLPVSGIPSAHRTTLGECANAWGVGTKFTNIGWSQYFKAE
jgi:hypothetical protein